MTRKRKGLNNINCHMLQRFFIDVGTCGFTLSLRSHFNKAIVTQLTATNILIVHDDYKYHFSKRHEFSPQFLLRHFQSKLAGSAQSDLIVAIAAIYRPIFAGLKWHLGSFFTLGAYRRKHFALRPIAIAIIPIAVATVTVLPCFSFLAA